ncbi:hypothetical protein NKR23_g4873 [Pleurostoma richardsiae]|uniref:Uncharacterized protein n=1 Tax=Pleurostoma richardsiae TaxID=41990 RepID=A0AA38VJZ7_9PEZI|nr:hypothetical protein NKR23_g4873 [Pleurostoma richardsiae]
MAPIRARQSPPGCPSADNPGGWRIAAVLFICLSIFVAALGGFWSRRLQCRVRDLHHAQGARDRALRAAVRDANAAKAECGRACRRYDLLRSWHDQQHDELVGLRSQVRGRARETEHLHVERRALFKQIAALQRHASELRRKVEGHGGELDDRDRELRELKLQVMFSEAESSDMPPERPESPVEEVAPPYREVERGRALLVPAEVGAGARRSVAAILEGEDTEYLPSSPVRVPVFLEGEDTEYLPSSPVRVPVFLEGVDGPRDLLHPSVFAIEDDSPGVDDDADVDHQIDTPVREEKDEEMEEEPLGDPFQDFSGIHIYPEED